MAKAKTVISSLEGANPSSETVQPENANNSGVGIVETRQKVIITFDRTDEQVLQFNMDKNLVLNWDEDRFRELPETVTRQLSYENLVAYLVVQTHVKEKKEGKKKPSKIEVQSINPLGMNTSYRLRIRERSGWHQCWKAPGGELEAALAGPYKQIRKQKATGKKDAYGEEVLETEEPGYENGEVLKILNDENKVELVAVECTEEVFKAGMEWQAKESRSRYRANTDKFTTTIEEINTGLSKDHKMKVLGNDE